MHSFEKLFRQWGQLELFLLMTYIPPTSTWRQKGGMCRASWEGLPRQAHHTRSVLSSLQTPLGLLIYATNRATDGQLPFWRYNLHVRDDVASGRQAHNIKSTLHSVQKPYYFQRDQHKVHFLKTAYLRIFIPSLLYILKSSLCPAVFAASGLRSLLVHDITQQQLNFKSWTPCSPWKETSLELSKSTI